MIADNLSARTAATACFVIDVIKPELRRYVHASHFPTQLVLKVRYCVRQRCDIGVGFENAVRYASVLRKQVKNGNSSCAVSLRLSDEHVKGRARFERGLL